LAPCSQPFAATFDSLHPVVRSSSRSELWHPTADHLPRAPAAHATAVIASGAHGEGERGGPLETAQGGPTNGVDVEEHWTSLAGLALAPKE